MANAVLAGVITLHSAMPAVLANFPDRACPECAGYVATADCSEIGRRFVLVMHGRDYLVQAADCLAAADAPGNRRMFGGEWIADVDEALWSGPAVPQTAELWPVNARRLYWLRWERMSARLEVM